MFTDPKQLIIIYYYNTSQIGYINLTNKSKFELTFKEYNCVMYIL